MPYKPETDCQDEREIRSRLDRANREGKSSDFKVELVALNSHHKICPVCQGVNLAVLLFQEAGLDARVKG
jgi:hypothetical protein